MRSFPTRLVSSVSRSLLPAPCLLICLACATPFPIESLEEGMTTEMVREKFGEPDAIVSDPGFAGWYYTYQKQNWLMTPPSPFTFWILVGFPFILPFNLLDPEVRWYYPLFVYDVDLSLHFEEEKLARWEVIKPGSSDSYWNGNWELMQSMDSLHHQMGHTHHHFP